MRDETRDFINEHEDLIDDFKIEELYNLLKTHKDRGVIMSELTDILISVGIFPWDYNANPDWILVHNQNFTEPFVWKYDTANYPRFYGCTFDKVVIDVDNLNIRYNYPFQKCIIKELEYSTNCSAAYCVTDWASKVSKVLFSSSVTDIMSNVFQTYSGTKMTIPDTVTGIHPEAFRSSSIQKVVLSNNIDMIPSRCFDYCSALQNVVIPVNVDYIAKGAFEDTSSLKQLTYKGTMEQWKNVFVYKDAFKDSALEEIVCTDGVVKFKKGK